MRQVRCAEFPLTIRPDIAAGADPGLAQARQALLRITMERIITPWAGAVIYPHRVIRLRCTIREQGVGKRHLTHPHLDFRVNPARHINAAGLRVFQRIR